MKVYDSLEDLQQLVGQPLGSSDWITVDQQRIDRFADATDDHQWIHVDPERAKEGPFGGTIAHGYLSLSLLPSFMFELIRVEGIQMGVNFGLNKVRFPRPVPVGSRVRAVAELTSVKGTPAGHLSALKMTIEVEGERRPACVAETLSLYVPAE